MVSLTWRMRNTWSLISYLGRAQLPLSIVVLLIFWNFCPQGKNSDCDGHLPPTLICDELLLIFPVTCGRNHHWSQVVSAFCISYLFSWAVPVPGTFCPPGEALPSPVQRPSLVHSYRPQPCSQLGPGYHVLQAHCTRQPCTTPPITPARSLPGM